MKFFLRKIILTGLFIGSTCLSKTFAQEPWMQPFVNSTHLNFYDIQSNFYSTYHKQYGKYLKQLKHKGKEEEVGEKYGIIQFKRWENFWQPRVSSDGSFPPANALYTALRNYRLQLNITDRSNSPMANWTNVGPVSIPSNTGSGRINVVRFDPNNPNKIFVGTPDGGLWVSPDGGNTWATTTDSLPSIGVTDVAIDPDNSDTIYIATGDGDASDSYSVGILKSTDGGNTWDTTGLSLLTNNEETISRLLINPQNPNLLLAATSRGIEQTTNGGISWTKQFVVGCKDMAFMPVHPSTVYASGSYFYKSIDGGSSWKPAGTGLPPASNVSRIAIAVSKADSNFVLALVADKTDYGLLGLYESTDAGNTFSLLYNSLNLLGWQSGGGDVGGQGWYDLTVAVSQYTTDTIFTGGVNVWCSTDGGSTFSMYGFWAGPFGGPYVHADDHFLTFSPDEKSIYTGCDGGIYQRPFTSSTWNDLSSGLSIMEIYSLSNSATNENLITTGAQDNGTCEMNGANNWGLILGGDGMQTIIDYTDPNIIYGEGSYGNINVSTDGGNNFIDIAPNSGATTNWVTPYIMDPNNHNIIYAGLDDIYETNNQGYSWTNLTNGLTGSNTYVALAVAPSNSNVIYVATSNQIFRSDNAGGTWINITHDLPEFDISSIAVKGSDPYTLWVTFSGFNSGYEVYKSIDSGYIWTNISTGLPGVSANCLAYQNNSSNDDLYVGTDLGVYYTNNTLTSWEPFNTGLPNVVIDQLGIQYGASVLRAATYGRGVWQTNLVTPTGIQQLSANNDSQGIIIYPNPASDYVNVKFEKNYSAPVVISLYNIIGQLEMQKTLESASADQSLQLDLTSQARGMYIIKVVSGTEIIATKKLVVIN